jgi:hypothetical protein
LSAGEWVVPLPQSGKGKTYGVSEAHYLSNSTFLLLSRDGDGKGGDDTESKYKQVYVTCCFVVLQLSYLLRVLISDLIDISKATNIAGTKYDDPANPVSPAGKLVSGITAATYASFVDMIDDDELERFGLHNDGDDDEKLINSKWEGLALAPVGDAANPDDYFLFVAVCLF